MLIIQSTNIQNRNRRPKVFPNDTPNILCDFRPKKKREKKKESLETMQNILL